MNSCRYLSKDTWIEILGRLPCKSLVRCKCVCKEWYHLISSSYFQSHVLYVRHHNDHDNMFDNDDDRERRASTFIFFNSNSSKPELFGSSKLFNLVNLNLSLDFILLENGEKYLQVLELYKDIALVGCSESNYYCLCNLHTKQWTALPPAPDKILNHNEKVKLPDPLFGLICEESVYKVVRIFNIKAPNEDLKKAYSSRFNLDVFSTDTDEWRQFILSISQTRTLALKTLNYLFRRLRACIAYKRKLFFLPLLMTGVFGFDPFSIVVDNNSKIQVIECFFIKASPAYGLIFPNERDHVFLFPVGCNYDDNKNMRMCSYCRCRTSVWELKKNKKKIDDGDDGYDWIDDGDVYDWILVATSNGNPLFHPNYPEAKPIGFDPNNDNILYIIVSGGFLIYDFVEGRIISVLEIASNIIGDDFYFTYFPQLVLPTSPTPLPSIKAFSLNNF